MRTFRNKTHDNEGKFYLTWNAHILGLKVLKKNSRKEKERSKTRTDFFTPVGNQEKIGTSLHSLVSDMAEECSTGEG